MIAIHESFRLMRCFFPKRLSREQADRYARHVRKVISNSRRILLCKKNDANGINLEVKSIV